MIPRDKINIPYIYVFLRQMRREDAHKSKVVSRRNGTFSPGEKKKKKEIDKQKSNRATERSRIEHRETGLTLSLYPFDGDAPSAPFAIPLFSNSPRASTSSPLPPLSRCISFRGVMNPVCRTPPPSLSAERGGGGGEDFPDRPNRIRPDIHPDHSLRIGNYALLHVRTTVLFGATPAAAANPRSHFASLHLSRPPALANHPRAIRSARALPMPVITSSSLDDGPGESAEW